MNKQDHDRKILWDKFKVTKINPQGKFFDNVSRYLLVSDSKIEMMLDVNSNIYPIDQHDTFFIQLSRRLNQRQVYSPDQLASVSDNDFEYIMNGIVFRIDLNQQTSIMNVYASFGGLMMKMTGDLSQLQNFKSEGVQARVLIMMRKI